MPTYRVHETDRCDLPSEASRRTDPDRRVRGDDDVNPRSLDLFCGLSRCLWPTGRQSE
jgi:hypothetical protein